MNELQAVKQKLRTVERIVSSRIAKTSVLEFLNSPQRKARDARQRARTDALLRKILADKPASVYGAIIRNGGRKDLLTPGQLAKGLQHNSEKFNRELKEAESQLKSHRDRPRRKSVGSGIACACDLSTGRCRCDDMEKLARWMRENPVARKIVG